MTKKPKTPKVFDAAALAVDTELSKAFDMFGKTVRDKVSGFTGIAVHIDEKINGSVSIGVQPQCKTPDDMPKAWLLDIIKLEVIEGPSLEPSPMKDVTIKVGSTVKDSVTDFTGTATERCYHLNGCITYRVEGKNRLTEIGDYVCREDIEQDRLQTVVAKEPTVKKTGSGGLATPSRF